MHMADALVSAPVALATGVAAATLVVIASKKVSQSQREEMVPLMGVLGAFIFAAQMINFTIPGTGSSGHIIGGILLAALLGPWAAFITLASVLIIQCLIFADGGLMALGCNLINMGALSTLVAYPLIYRPIAGKSLSNTKIMVASVLASVVGLELGALFVTGETELSGITALPASQFLMFMLPIHLVIGLCEGIATGLVLIFVKSYKPDLLYQQGEASHTRDTGVTTPKARHRRNVVIAVFAGAALLLGGIFTWIASSNPDGLEWSIAKVTGSTDLAPATTPASAFMADYANVWSGVVGGVIVLLVVWGLSAIIFRKRHAQD